VGRFGDGGVEHQEHPTGAGDDFKIDASYALGDTKNVISTAGGSPACAMFSGTGRAGLIRASVSVRRRMPSGSRTTPRLVALVLSATISSS